ncbi:MAG: 50S ribosomal protein L25/general stress protein Ctc [Actinomycetales bacterium]|nr:50S ribosomal protein L25/general stress protein Ctc [Actinomycetales bacterium]
MSEAIKMVAEVRTSFGKGAARKARAAGRTPAVIYGHGSEPQHITLPAHEIALVLRHKNAFLDLDIAGKSNLVLVKSATKDPVTQVIEHIDLIVVVMGEKVHIEVPVHVNGEVLSGTIVDLEHKTVKLEAPSHAIPEFVVVNINKPSAGTHFTAADVVLPAGVKMDLAADELVVSILESKAAHSEELAAGE